MCVVSTTIKTHSGQGVQLDINAKKKSDMLILKKHEKFVHDIGTGAVGNTTGPISVWIHAV